LKIAILSDIHGNIYALEAVLLQIEKEKIDTIWVLGDSIGYYYCAKEVLTKLKKFNLINLRGNHEDMLDGIINNTIDIETVRIKYGSGIQLAKDTLNSNEIKFLLESPKSHALTISNSRFLISHESPHKDYPYIYPDSNDEIFDELNHLEYDFLIFGHSHYQFIKTNKKNTIINPGSVGQSRSQGGVANWVIMNLDNNVIIPKATPYSIEPLINDILKYDPLNSYLINILKRNNE